MSAQILHMIVLNHVTLSLTTSLTLLPTLLLMLPLSLWNLGEHLLDSKGLVQVVINNADNLTLRGEKGHSNTDIIIRCSSNTRGLIFNNSMIINIYDVSITGCGQDGIPPLLLTNITSLYIHHIMLYNNMYNGTHFGGILYVHCVTNTNITFTNNTVGNGGGLYISGDGTDITITNSAFTNNTVGRDGGGVYIYGNSADITVTDSAFTNNIVGGGGGGLYIYGYGAVNVTNSIFTNNIVGGGGGGLYIYGYGADITVNVTNSAFTNNTVGRDGGGMYIYGNSADITVTNSAFTNNIVGGGGGGLYIYGYGAVNVTNSIFTNNIVGGGGGGLYIYGYGADITVNVTNSAFTNNTVGHDGGGLYIYGNGADITVTNSAFTNNIVGGGGGGLYIYGYGADITVTNSTFTNNNGSGILAHSHVTVAFTEGHSIVANNSSPTDGGGIYLGEDCYLTTSHGGHVSFINNTAQRYGGAIYSHDYLLLHMHAMNYWKYSTYYYYYYFNNAYHNQCTIYSLSATFYNNSAAIAGDQLYGGAFLYHGFIWEDITTFNYDCPNTIKNAPSVNSLSPISSDPSLVVCPCVNGAINCTVRSLDREVYPGQMLQVPLVSLTVAPWRN